MHRFWRGTIAVVTGSVCGFSFQYFLGWIIEFVVVRTDELCAALLLMFMPTALLAIVVFLMLTRLYGPKYIDPNTRCRKCGYILRGIPEPRCSECGEKI
ncbi:MAG: hypothetical protein ACYTF1_02260 [Planctomycetota bacterium]|jgi:biotin transporter BioY